MKAPSNEMSNASKTIAASISCEVADAAIQKRKFIVRSRNMMENCSKDNLIAREANTSTKTPSCKIANLPIEKNIILGNIRYAQIFGGK